MVWYSDNNSRTSLGSIFSDSFVKPTMSVNKTATFKFFGIYSEKLRPVSSISFLISGEKYLPKTTLFFSKSAEL